MSDDQKVADRTPSMNIQCLNCREYVGYDELEAYEGYCPHCYTPMRLGGFIEEGVGHDDEYEQYTTDVEFRSTFSLFYDNCTTLCCYLDQEDCECEFPDRAPEFDSALDKYLSVLPTVVYDPAPGVPCHNCVHQWNGGCEPLRIQLHLVHTYEEYRAAGIDEEDLYLGVIDGCVNYTKTSVGEEYVRHVSIRARRS